LVIFLPSSNIQSPLIVIASPISASFWAYLKAFSNKLATISAITAYFAFNGDTVQSGQREGSVQSLFSKSALALPLSNIGLNKL